jgi:hypothetical protein
MLQVQLISAANRFNPPSRGTPAGRIKLKTEVCVVTTKTIFS